MASRTKKVAKKLSGFELTERVTSARLTRWLHEFPGKQTREALLALGDASAFLDLPSSEVLQIEMPDGATRKQILSRAVEYVKTTVHALPNFLAWRRTTHFEDLRKSGIPYASSFYIQPQSGDPAPTEPRPLKVTERATTKVTYRDGLEVADAGAGKGRIFGSPGMLLTTSGEFGPILSVVIEDASRGQVYWSHWERGPTGPAAVLDYVVPQEISNFAVSLGMIGNEAEQQFPAYHGEIAIDPASGSILRLTAVSELRPLHWVFTSSIVVEYGPVTIGNREYICPVRSEALFRLAESEATGPAKMGSLRFLTYLNDVSFTDYHLFRGDVRMVP